MLDNLITKYRDLQDKRENGEGGFTLIELLVVVVIIGILIAIAIPLYLNYQKGANDKSSQSDLRAAVSSLQQCYSQNGNSNPDTVQTTTGGAITDPADIKTSFQFKCGTNGSERVNLSDGTHLGFAYDADSKVVTMTTWNPDGKKNANTDNNNFKYVSNAGGAIK